jgi:alpha-tubulin suppressor-like RCC1 family protein
VTDTWIDPMWKRVGAVVVDGVGCGHGPVGGGQPGADGRRRVPSAVLAVVVAVLGLAGGLAVPRPAAAAPATGLALAWGNNASGQLGDGTTTERTTPVNVVLPAGVTITQVSAGANHSLAVTSDGRVLAWGDNGVGQLGDGTTTTRLTPVEVALPAGVTITQVSAGNEYSLAVTSDGSALAWGDNSFGQLGDGTTTTRLTPVQVDLPAGVTITQVAAGIEHSLAVTSDGHALAWGDNSVGQLGDGTTTRSSTPVQVHLPAGVTVTQVSAGSHSLAVTSDGRVLAWGFNFFGQLGDGTTTTRLTPVEVALPTGVTVTQVAAGAFHSLAVTSDGHALAWGINISGQLGDGTTTRSSTPVQVHLPAGVTATQVSAGSAHSLAVTSDGRVLAWGDNGSGQLGDDSTTDSAIPVQVDLPAGVTVTQVAAGGNHSLALAQRESSTSLTATPAQATPGTPITLTAKVTCAGATPTGTVTFLDGTTRIGTGTLDTTGTATLTTTSLSLGAHTITARYDGDGTCAASTSDPVTVTITTQPTTPTTPPAGGLPITGTPLTTLATTAAALLTIGAALIAYSRRRRPRAT